MLERTSGYDAAIVGSPRHIFLRAIVDISDPDKEWLPVTGSPQAPWSHPEEIHDKLFDVPPRYATGEPGRWLLGGGFDLFPEDYQVPEHVGYVGAALSGPDGTFETPQVVQENFKGMSILQACSVFFSTDPLDGVAVDFTVEVLYNGQVFYAQAVTGNREAQMQFDGFTVYDPTSIRITVTRWSLPGRRVRVTEIVPGLFEDWDADMLEGLSVTQQGQFSCLTLPYGTAEISMDNSSRRFEPRRKDGVFQSIEERQGIELYIGVLLESGGVEYKQIGVYYQAGSGWRTGDNGMTQKWSLVDIAGLLAERTFLPPQVLPETLEGWIAAVVAQLGDSFRRRYRVDPDYANVPVTASSAEDVSGKSCGDIIRWACMASGTWPRADSKTGALTAEPLWSQGAKLDLDNLESYPGMKANESLAALIFRLADEESTEYVVSGNSTSSEKTVTIVNPFIHTPQEALTAARLILSQYGGNVIETTGRGNPASEIGDVDTIWLDESNATTARRMSQTFQIQDGVLQGCRSTLLQADGSYLYTEFAIMEDDEGDFLVPEGVEDFRLVLSDGGQGGGYGNPGVLNKTWSSSSPGAATSAGEAGQDGAGGRVWYGTIKLNPGSIVHYKRGAGGAAATATGVPGGMGQPSTFGAYNSENGILYPNGYTDIANGQAFCRTGVEAPLPGTGDGGKGGDGGEPGVGYWKQLYWTPDIPGYSDSNAGHPRGQEFVVTRLPGPGHRGMAGASGFIMLMWQKPESEI